jgi:hypothetical protein
MRTKTSDLDVTGPLVQHARTELAALIAEEKAGAVAGELDALATDVIGWERGARGLETRQVLAACADLLKTRAAALRSGTGEKGGE